MSGKHVRVLLDTNIFVSYLLSAARSQRPFDRILDAVLSRSLDLLLSDQLLDEVFNTITTKPYLAERIDLQNARHAIEALRRIAILLPRPSGPIPPMVRDPDDDIILAYALMGRADYLITGDKDLLALGDLAAPLTIVRPAEFVKEMDVLGDE